MDVVRGVLASGFTQHVHNVPAGFMPGQFGGLRRFLADCLRLVSLESVCQLFCRHVYRFVKFCDMSPIFVAQEYSSAIRKWIMNRTPRRIFLLSNCSLEPQFRSPDDKRHADS
jgi:hypothetical protein